MKNHNLSFSLPRLSLASLILCLISGIILAFQYRPIGNVFQNVEEITTMIPYGRFFRQFHYGAGQLFVMLMLLHTMDHFLKRKYEYSSFSKWLFLVISLSLCFFTLFTGFILKGDKEGSLAGVIFLNIMKEMPLIGEYWARLFIIPGEPFFLLPYLYHCFFLPLLIILLIKDHIREWMPDYKFIFTTTIGLFLFALFIDPAIDIPPEADVTHVKGPWFFLGIQSLLGFIPPFWAGLIIPGLYMGLLIILPVTRGAWGKTIHYLIMVSCVLYAALTLYEYIMNPLKLTN